MRKIIILTFVAIVVWQIALTNNAVVNLPEYSVNNLAISETEYSENDRLDTSELNSSHERNPQNQQDSNSKPQTTTRFAETELPSFHEGNFAKREYRALAVPNDPYADQSWERTIGLDVARNQLLGDYTPKVAVIDGGFALEHEDLRDVWLTNSSEAGATTNEADSILNCSDQSLPVDYSCNVVDDDFNGIIDDESGDTSYENKSLLNCTDQNLALDKSCNLIDDDDNGLIDDYKGFDFANYERSAAAGETDANGDGVNHGTLVTGVLAATNDNNIGLAGVNSNVEVLPVQVLDDDGRGFSISVADGIIYAVSRGVDVINLSLGSSSKDAYIEQAIDYATRQGVTVVAASGNDGCECLFYPAGYKPVVAVGAANGSEQLTSFSNYGVEQDVIAPGVSLYTSSWSSANQTGLYQYASGTSLAAPVVSGVLSRLVSYHPELSPLQLKSLLLESTDKSMLSGSDVRNTQYGYGLLDADYATSRATIPLTSSQLTVFDYIRAGDQGVSGEYPRQELDVGAVAYQCTGEQKPATSVYRLSKNSKLAFTASEQEVEAAKRAGFNATRLFDVCILFPHDNPETQRTINTAREILNTSNKRLY